jgi:hypothetical protein
VAKEGVKRRAAIAAALMAAAAAHGADDCAASLQAAKPLVAEGDGARIVFVPRPQPVSVGRHFHVDFVVCGRDGTRSDAAVQVDADMPAHRHGMNYRSTVSSLGAGVQRAQGLMFHMPGTWRLIFDVTVDGRQVRVTREIEAR